MLTHFKGVKIYNPTRPWMYIQGGKIPIRPTMSVQQRINDSVKIIAQPGELIIPVKHKRYKDGELVKDVVRYLGQKGVRLPNT
jgi:hypothetical protein